MIELRIEGRRIIPIRAIPDVTGRDVDSLNIAWILAERVPQYHPKASLDSFHLERDGKYHKMFPREWDVVIADLERLEKELGKEVERWRIHHPVWREKSIALIPQASFAWWDEFKDAHSTMYPPENKLPFDDRSGYQEINEHPHLDPKISTLIYEGFDILLPPEDTESSKSTESKLPSSEMDDRNKEIGLIARRLRRKNRGWSERKIADQVYIERGRKDPKPERLRQIIREYQKIYG